MEQSTRRESLTDIAEKKIFDYLRENHFRPGDRLPMESELAEKFQISRTVVREALSRLRMMGFIESKKRRGMVVAHPNIFETIAKVIDPAFLDEEEKQDFFQLRLTIELGLADLLAEHLTEKDLADLEEIVREEERDPPTTGVFSRATAGSTRASTRRPAAGRWLHSRRSCSASFPISKPASGTLRATLPGGSTIRSRSLTAICSTRSSPVMRRRFSG